MTEGEARAALRRFNGIGGLERWIAERPWQAAQGAWTVSGELESWTFKVAAGQWRLKREREYERDRRDQQARDRMVRPGAKPPGWR